MALNMKDFLGDETEQPLDRIPENGGFTAIFRTIAVVGDSLSSGEMQAYHGDGKFSYHDYYEHSWGQYLGRMCGSKVYNFSVGGMTAKKYCDYFAEEKGFWDPALAADAYILALGVNDLLGEHSPIGSVADIDFSDWRNNNEETFCGYYARIIQRLKEIQPRAKFFLMTMCDDREDLTPHTEHRRLLLELAEAFDNTYVLDFLTYAPQHDADFRRNFYLCGHMNPMGYYFTAKLVGAYIDYIIRHNMNDFAEVGFIGTDYHGYIAEKWGE